MATSSKLIISLLTFSIIIPIISFFIVKNNIFTYHSYKPNVGDEFYVQVFYQTTPINDLNYIVIANNPIDIKSSVTVDLIPRIIDYHYYLLPRGIFFRDKSIPEPQNSIFKHKNILIKVWRQYRNRKLKYFYLKDGKCFPIFIDKKLKNQWREKSNFSKNKLWQILKKYVQDNK